MAVRNLQDSTRTDTVHEILFVQSRNPRMEQWIGRRFGPDGAMKLLGVQHALTVEKFPLMFQSVVGAAGMKHLYAADLPEGVNARIAKLLQPVRSFIDEVKATGSQVEVHDPTSV